jgi:hypothetical protein
MEWPRAEDLLAGPRGRRLCWSLLEPGDYPGWDLVWDGAHRGNLTEVLAASGPATSWLELHDEPLGWTLGGASA